MPDRIGDRLGLDRAAVGYALRMFVAAMLAFSIASLLHVENAYWAAMPVWVVAQAQRGLLFERALFRIAGTVLGAAAGFGILWLSAQPTVVLALLALWVALNSGLTRILRGVQSYGALMAGITAAVVALPSLLDPGHSLNIAVARVECTLIGVLVVTFVTGAATPESPRAAFYARVRELAGDAVASVAELLAGAKQELAERRILREIAEVDAAAALVMAGSIEGYRRIRHVNAFIAASLAMMAVGQTLARRKSASEWAAEPLPRLLKDFAARLRTRDSPAAQDLDLRVLLQKAAAIEARLGAVLEQLVRAEAALFSAAPGSKEGLAPEREIRLAPYYDWPLACRTGLVSGIATFLAAALGLASGWPAAELGALGVCIFSMLLGSVPKPKVVAPAVLKGVVAGVIAATFYRFVVLPHVATVPELVFSVMPFILLGAFARASRKTALPALDANMCFLLASQAVLPPVTDPRAILNGGAALILAAATVTIGFMLFPRTPRDPRALAAGTARTIVNDLERLIAGTALSPDADAHRARQVLRLMLHLSQAGDLRGMPSGSILAALNLGNAIAELQALSRPGAPQPVAVSAIFAGFAGEPRRVAAELLHHADSREGQAVAWLLRDAAHALSQCASLFAIQANPEPRSTSSIKRL
jgi:uncharacterized membrane protein YccC